MSRWSEFHARHGERKYTPVFNTFLDAMIRDEEAPLSERVWAWIIRRSWGNHSDSCVDADGIIQTQVDCARDLGIKDKNGETNRRIVNPVFQEFERRKFVRFEGREIVPADDPAADPMAETFENASKVLPLSDFSRKEGESKAFPEFIQQVWAKQHPDEYLRYQKVEQEWKEIRTSILSEWKTFQRLSERGRTNGSSSVREGQDNLSERGRTNDEPILIGVKPLNGNTAAAFSTEVEPTAKKHSPPPLSSYGLPEPEKEIGLVAIALAEYEAPERGDVIRIVEACRKRDPEATAEEIATVIHKKGKRWRGPGLAFFLEYVPKCFPIARMSTQTEVPPEDREQRIAELQAQLEDQETGEPEKVIIRKLLALAQAGKRAEAKGAGA